MSFTYDERMWRLVSLLLYPLAIQAGPFRVVVDDATKARVAQAEVTLSCAASPAQKARTDESGTAMFAGKGGECQVVVTAPGFQPWRGHVAPGADQLEAHLAVLQPGTRVVVDGARPKSPVGRFVNWLTSCTRR